MKWLRRTGRALAALVFSVMVITVGTSIYLRIDQYRFRRQAENLLADVRGLQLRKASAEDVRRIVKKWGFEGVQSTGEPCTQEDCNYYLRIIAPDPIHLYNRLNIEILRKSGRVLAFLGQHPADVESWLQIRGEVLRSALFSVSMFGRADDGSDCTLKGYSGGTRMEGSFSDHDRPDIKLRQSLHHPSYLAGTYLAMLNVDTFQASPAVVVWAEFSPDANASDVSRLMQFDLNCLTRVRSCTNRDLMPTVWAQAVEDNRGSAASLTCTPEISRRAAAIADVIAVLRPTTVVLQPSTYEGRPPSLTNLEIVSVIKKPKHPRSFGRFDVEIDNPEMAVAADTGAHIGTSQPYIMLLQLHTYRGGGGGIALYPCGVLTSSDANLAMVRDLAAESEQESE